MPPAHIETRHQAVQELPRVDGDEALENPKGDQDEKMPPAPRSDTLATMQGGTILAKQAERYLVRSVSGDKLEAIPLDPKQFVAFEKKYEPECIRNFVTKWHTGRLDCRVKAAAGDPARFEIALNNVLKSNTFGNKRVIWRLEFEGGEHGLHCGQSKHDEICEKLKIHSFHELKCGKMDVQSDLNKAHASKILTNEYGTTYKRTLRCGARQRASTHDCQDSILKTPDKDFTSEIQMNISNLFTVFIQRYSIAMTALGRERDYVVVNACRIIEQRLKESEAARSGS